MMKTLTSSFVLPSLAGYFGALAVVTLANANFITLTSEPGDFVDAGTNQIFTLEHVNFWAEDTHQLARVAVSVGQPREVLTTLTIAGYLLPVNGNNP